MLYNMFLHPCKCINTRLRHLRLRLWGVCNTLLPYYKNGTHKIRMYPGRCVLHTPPERFRRKRRNSPMYKNDHSPPPAAFVGRMLLRPYAGYTHHIKIRTGYVNSPNVSLPNPGWLREPAAASGRGDFATFATIMRRQSTMTLRFAQPLTPHTSFDATR